MAFLKSVLELAIQKKTEKEFCVCECDRAKRSDKCVWYKPMSFKSKAKATIWQASGYITLIKKIKKTIYSKALYDTKL